MYTLLRRCKACGSSDLQPVMDFGFQPLANNFRNAAEAHAGAAPLKVLFCRACTLAQLSVVVEPSVLYNHYAYVTSTSDMMLQHFARLEKDLKHERGGKLGHLLEIGSNDGLFLEYLKPGCESVMGVDPAKNLCAIAEAKGIRARCVFWGYNTSAEFDKFDTIIARHVFCHCPDWHDFIGGLEHVSHDATVIAIEVPYAGDLLQKNEFDTIYHEHLCYLTIRSMNALLEQTSLYLHKIIPYTIHGGAILLILKKRTGHEVAVPSDDIKAESWVWLDGKAREMMQELRGRVKYLAGMKNRICGYGASAKSTLWLNGCGFKKHELEFVHDITPQKQNTLVPGTDIPVFDARKQMREGISHAVLFAWNYADEIIEKEKDLRARGVSFIVPVPKLTIIDP